MTAQEIATQLNEPNIELIETIVQVLGIERVTHYLQRALRIEADGGMLTHDGSRRRSTGGVFFRLVKSDVNTAERHKIWPPVSNTPQPPKTPHPKKAAPEIHAIRWEEAKPLIAAIIQSPGKGASVKLTLVGRPKKVAKAGEGAVVVSLQGKPPGALPKGLPTPPEAGITWAVFIANKQWSKVKDSMTTHVDDLLIIEGYPMVDKNGIGVVLATNVKSKLMEQTAKVEQKQTNHSVT